MLDSLLFVSQLYLEPCIAPEALKLGGLFFVLLSAFCAYHLSQSHYIATVAFEAMLLFMYFIGIVIFWDVVILSITIVVVWIAAWVMQVHRGRVQSMEDEEEENEI